MVAAGRESDGAGADVGAGEGAGTRVAGLLSVGGFESAVAGLAVTVGGFESTVGGFESAVGGFESAVFVEAFAAVLVGALTFTFTQTVLPRFVVHTRLVVFVAFVVFVFEAADAVGAE